MDNDQNQTPPQPIQPAVEQPSVANGNKKSILLLVALFALVIIGAAGIFVLMNKKEPSETPPTATYQALPTPTTQPTKSPEEELDQLTIESADEDFKDINTDLEQL